MIRLFVIDDHPLILDGIQTNVNPQQDQIEIVGVALNMHQAIQLLAINDVDIILLDLYLPDSFPLNNVRILKNKFKGKKIIIFTSETSGIWVEAMKNEGVNAYLTKLQSASKLKEAIINVFNGDLIFPPWADKIDLSSKEEEHQTGQFLTPVQRCMIQLLCDGFTAKEIADFLDINIFRVNYVFKKIRRTYNVKNNVELIATLHCIK
jgi:DNA-binding NarL/FixJ family response regulator